MLAKPTAAPAPNIQAGMGPRASGLSDRHSQAGSSSPAGCRVQAHAGGPLQPISDASGTGAWGGAVPVVPPPAPRVGTPTEKKAWAVSGSLRRRGNEPSGAQGGIKKWRLTPVLLVEDQPRWELPASGTAALLWARAGGAPGSPAGAPAPVHTHGLAPCRASALGDTAVLWAGAPCQQSGGLGPDSHVC